ncbi:MAG: hypothetical protein P1U40_06770 [Coxiellaceae bacterium]|nr:hypothetical protein [Coxiellaceae bacterium]
MKKTLTLLLALLPLSLLANHHTPNFPSSLNGKTLYAAYTYGKPAGKVLKVTYANKTFVTTEIPSGKKLTGQYTYQVTDKKKGIASMTLIPNQSQFDGSTQKLTFHFESAGLARFSDNTEKTGAKAGGLIGFATPSQ